MSASRRLVRSVSRSNARRAVALGAAAGLAGATFVAPAVASASPLEALAAPFTAADETSETPVELKASYKLDGKKISAEDLVGRSGLVEVTYLVRNRTTKPTEIRYKDGKGAEVVETVDLVAPYVGRLNVALPGGVSDLDADGAEVHDGFLGWSLVLFDPIGAPAHQLRFTMRMTDAQLPGAKLDVAKVGTEGGVLSTGTAAAGEASGASTRLTEGLVKIDSSVLKLRDGAQQLLDGLVQLADGTAELEAGLADKAAPGAQKLSDGLGQARAGGGKLDDGVGQLADGSVALRDGLGKANAGGARLSTGLADLAGGADKLAAGLTAASAGGQKLGAGLGQIEDGLGAAKTGSGQLAVGLGSASAGADALAGGLPAIADGLDKVQAGLTKLGVELPAGLTAALDQVQKGVSDISAGYIDGALVPGIDKIKASIHSTSPMAPGAVQRLACAQKILSDVAAGTLTTTAGQPNACYFDATTNPSALTPALTGLSGTDKVLVDKVTAGLADSAAKLGTPTDTSDTTLLGGLNRLRAGLDFTPTAAGQTPGMKQALLGGVNPGIDKVEAGVLGALAAALGAPTTDPESADAKTLIGGTSLLAAGADKAVAGSGTLAGGLQQLSAGGTKLDGGLAQLLAGATAASDGADTLNGGLTQLADGGGKLAAGGGTAAAGGAELSKGLQQLAEGGVKLSDGLGKAKEGTGALVNGLGQLDDGGKQLATGLKDAADGSGKIAEGTVKVRDGVQAVRDGAGELSGRGTSLIANSVNASAIGNAKKLAMLEAISGMSSDPSTAPSFDIVLAGATSEAEDGVGGLAVAGSAAALALLTMAAAGVLVARRRRPAPVSTD